MIRAVENAMRYVGFSDIYEESRPIMPNNVVKTIYRYLEKKPDLVVDLGCGTGLSTLAWKNNCNKIIGVEPSEDMYHYALSRKCKSVSFINEFAQKTGLPDQCADVVVCSQSFHWMEPMQTLTEINRLLKKGGIFVAVDCDWPPLCTMRAELAYGELFENVREIRRVHPEVEAKFKMWNKNEHLNNIKECGYFVFSREVVFSNSEKCSANKFIKIATSQGSVQNILKFDETLIEESLDNFKNQVLEAFNGEELEIEYSYRMRFGVK